MSPDRSDRPTFHADVLPSCHVFQGIASVQFRSTLFDMIVRSDRTDTFNSFDEIFRFAL